MSIVKNNYRSLTISLVIPTYNDEKTIIPQVLVCEKILKSYCHDYEIIIADDVSSDSTRKLLSKQFKNNKRIKPAKTDFKREKNKSKKNC